MKIRKQPTPIGPVTHSHPTPAAPAPPSSSKDNPRIIPIKGKQQILVAQAQQELNEAQAVFLEAQAKFEGKRDKLNSVAQMVIAGADLEGNWQILPGGVGIIEVFPEADIKNLPPANMTAGAKMSLSPPEAGKLPDGAELLVPGPAPDKPTLKLSDLPTSRPEPGKDVHAIKEAIKAAAAKKADSDTPEIDEETALKQ